MEIKYLLSEDYNDKRKLGKETIFCFSKKKLDELYPDKDYKIIGEISGEISEDSDKNVFLFHNKKYKISPYGTANKFIYSKRIFIGRF